MAQKRKEALVKASGPANYIGAGAGAAFALGSGCYFTAKIKKAKKEAELALDSIIHPHKYKYPPLNRWIFFYDFSATIVFSALSVFLLCSYFSSGFFTFFSFFAHRGAS